MLKLLLERESRTLRQNEQYEVEVKDLKEAVRVKEEAMGHLGSRDTHYAESGRVTLEDGSTYFITPNGRIWDREYWISSKGACYNTEAIEVFA